MLIMLYTNQNFFDFHTYLLPLFQRIYLIDALYPWSPEIRVGSQIEIQSQSGIRSRKFTNTRVKFILTPVYFFRWNLYFSLRKLDVTYKKWYKN